MRKLLFLILILFVAGCSNSNQAVKTEATTPQQVEQVAQQQPVKEAQITPSFPTTLYSTPFVEFLYPSDWKENKSDSKYVIFTANNSATIKNKADERKFIILNVEQRYFEETRTSSQARNIFENSFKTQDIEIKDNTNMINDNIAVIEFTDWGNLKIHVKDYFYTNGNGKVYKAEIFSDKDNWDNIQEIIKVFEQSLKFKQ